jgi:LppP/LprE lipoprotein
VRGPLVAAVLAATAAAALPSAAQGSGPSHASAKRYAHRTYIKQLGQHRRFALQGGRHAVTAADGSRITAWNILLADSGDGSGEAVILFRNRRFLGWASAFASIHVAVHARGRAIRVVYGVYSGNDPFCCPHATRTIGYRWNGSRIVASATPPREYGRRGPRLHLAAG